MVTPAGAGAQRTWEGLLAGGRFVRAAPWLDLEGCATRFAAAIGDFAPPAEAPADPVCGYAAAAYQDYVLSSLPRQTNPLIDLQKSRLSQISIGTSKGGVHSFSSVSLNLIKGPYGVLNPREDLFCIPPDAPARCLAARATAGGMHATVAACATGTLAAIRGVRLIEDGDAEQVLAGSSDASLVRLWFAAFERMGVLAPEHPVKGPAWACRPFDAHRNGFALGEGAAVLALESGDSVRRRGARPIARIAGAAMTTDPAGLTAVSPDAEPLVHAIRLACERAGCRPEEIVCIHAHGTGTRANDMVEARAIRTVLRAHARNVPIVSVKGAIGHLLGAAGAVELALAALTCQQGISPGNVTLEEPDPELGELCLPRETFRPGCGPVLKTALGFGGHVAAVVLTPA